MRIKTFPIQPRTIWMLAAAAVCAAALAVRVVDLNDRPLHGDEANNTWKFKQLWLEGGYRFDPAEYHGPMLPYATLPFAWASPADSYAQTDERFYRLVTVAFGLWLLLLTLASAGAIGRGAALAAGAWLAISPAMVFYARYYIHETPLVFWTAGALLALWRFAEDRRAGRPGVRWALAAGACIGLMHATKETFVIAVFAMGAAAAGTLWWEGALRTTLRDKTAWRGIGWLAAAAVACSVLLFSQFLTDWRGPLDSLAAYGVYAGRAGGSGSAADHTHPWWWYLSILAYYKAQPGPWFGETALVVLAVVGAAFSTWGRAMDAAHRPYARFLLLYTLIMIAVYSAIPYKTPWCLLGFLHGMILLAGLGAAALWRTVPGGVWARGGVSVLLLAAAAHLGHQNRQINFRFHAHPRNPHVYGHPLRSVVKIEQVTRQVAAVAGADVALHVYDTSNFWPIPFYLRHLSNVRYFGTAEDGGSIPPDADAPMILIEPGQRDALDPVLRETYFIVPISLRPRQERLLYVRQALWDRVQAAGGER